MGSAIAEERFAAEPHRSACGVRNLADPVIAKHEGLGLAAEPFGLHPLDVVRRPSREQGIADQPVQESHDSLLSFTVGSRLVHHVDDVIAARQYDGNAD